MDIHDTTTPTTPSYSRRKVLALGAAVGAGLAVGAPASPAAAHSVVQYSTIWDQPTYYENLSTGTATRTNFSYNSTFHSQLNEWFSWWYGYTPTNWVQPVQIWSNGVHVDNKPAGSLHITGRAMDFSRIRPLNYNNGSRFDGFHGRYDIWRNYTGTALTTARKRYWGTVATLNRYFGVVLTYAYNTAHHNHVHADNGEPNTFNRSRSQNLMVQAVCTYIWGYSTSIDGLWGSQTDTNSRKVLQRLGLSGGLTTSVNNWRNFCMTSLGQATGRFNY
jgi:hypothetical protein